jgi:hypothetical protein
VNFPSPAATDRCGSQGPTPHTRMIHTLPYYYDEESSKIDDAVDMSDRDPLTTAIRPPASTATPYGLPCHATLLCPSALMNSVLHFCRVSTMMSSKIVYILSIVSVGPLFAPFLYNSVMSSFQVNLCVSAALCTWPNLVLSSSSESTQTADVLAIDGPVLD